MSQEIYAENVALSSGSDLDVTRRDPHTIESMPFSIGLGF
jgi:hypothetical protein